MKLKEKNKYSLPDTQIAKLITTNHDIGIAVDKLDELF